MLAMIIGRLGFGGCVAVVMAALLGVQTVRLSLADHWISNAKAAEKAAKAVQAVKTTAGVQIAAEASQGIQAAQEHTRTVTRTLIQKVTEYVPAAADADCVVNAGVVQFLDAAAQVPTAARGPVEAPSGLPISAVAANVAANYGIAYDWKAEALGWRTWYQREAASWNAPPR